MVTKNAQRILKSILRDIPKIGDVTTTELLYRCQELSWILELDEQAKQWIQQELEGYLPQVFGREDVPDDRKVPAYRLVTLASKITSPKRGSSESMGSNVFSILYPCQYLETTVESTTLVDSHVVNTNPRSLLIYQAEVSSHILKGISSAIRARIHLFTIQQSLAIQVGVTSSNFFENTLSRIANTIGIIAPSTLDLLNELVQDLKRSKSPERLRVILETLRTIIRRITSVLITKDMLEENEEMPSEGAISTKTSKILNWVLANLEGKSKEEIKHLKKAVTRYHDQLKMLDDLVNKPIHKDLQSVDKAQVERITISIIAWIGDLVEILDKAGYEWVAN